MNWPEISSFTLRYLGAWVLGSLMYSAGKHFGGTTETSTAFGGLAVTVGIFLLIAVGGSEATPTWTGMAKIIVCICAPMALGFVKYRYATSTGW